MEKNLRSRPEHKLERFRGLFFQLGLTIALAAVWMAFEWSAPDANIKVPDTDDPIEWEETVIPVTVPKKLKPKVVEKIEPKVDPVSKDLFVNDMSFLPVLDNTDLTDDSVQTLERIFETELYDFVEVEMMPRFDACEGVALEWDAQKACFEREMQKALQRNFTYPKRSIMVQEQGVVWLGFVVNDRGEFVDVYVQRGVGPDLDAEAVRALSRIQPIQPATIAGRPVSVRYMIPLKAILR